MCALNVLTKGLIGLVFPAGAIGLYLLLTGDLRHLLRLRLFSSALVFFAIAAPWHILAALRNPAQGQVRGFLWFYFINDTSMRFLGKRVPRGYDTVPLAALLGALLACGYSLERIPAASRSRKCRGAWRELPRANDAAAACESFIFLVERGHRGLLQPLDATGVLHHPGLPGMALAGGRMAATRESIRCGQPRTARRTDFIGGVAGSRSHHRCGWLCLALVFEGAGSGHGSVGPAAKKSAGLRTLVRALSGFDSAGDGSIPRAAVRILARRFCWERLPTGFSAVARGRGREMSRWWR